MGAMKGPVLVVPKNVAESIRSSLAELSMLNRDASVIDLGDMVGFPVVVGNARAKRNIISLGKLTEMELIIRPRPPRSYKDLLDLPPELAEQLPSAFDMIGDVCIVKVPEPLLSRSAEIAEAILEANRNVRKVALDRGVKGEFRVRDLEVIGGEADLETVHIENNIRLKLDPSKVYFSPRLATERMRIAQMTGDERVLDMFCGVGPFALTLARHSPARSITGIDLNPDCIRYFNNNISINSASDRVEAILGDANEVAPALGTFDRIVMNLPHSSLDFLPTALDIIGEGVIHLYRMVQGQSVREEISELDSIMKGAKRGYRLEGIRDVHQYSPDSHMMALDIRLTRDLP